MKLRAGFVSNSSSSNFILTVPKGTSEENIRFIVENLVGDMEMKDFFIPDFRQKLIDTIMECRGNKITLEEDLKWENKWIKNHPGASTGERDELLRKIESGLDYYGGGFSDNGEGPIQAFLCEMNFEVEKDGFKMVNEAGY